MHQQIPGNKKWRHRVSRISCSVAVPSFVPLLCLCSSKTTNFRHKSDRAGTFFISDKNVFRVLHNFLFRLMRSCFLECEQNLFIKNLVSCNKLDPNTAKNRHSAFVYTNVYTKPFHALLAAPLPLLLRAVERRSGHQGWEQKRASGAEGTGTFVVLCPSSL